MGYVQQRSRFDFVCVVTVGGYHRGRSASTNDVNAEIVWVGQDGSARDVLVNGREGQAGEEVSVSVFLSSSIEEAEVIGRKKFHPALNARFGFSDLANLLEALMVGENEEVHTE